MKHLYELTALEQRELLARGEITAESLTRQYLRRIAAYDQPCGLNSVAFFDPTSIEQARKLDKRKAQENLPLFGLPVLIKDNIDVAGLPNTAGSSVLTDNIARRDAPIVANLRKNGAVILGKTNMTEFAHYTSDNMPNGFSSRGGQVRCAYKADHDPSGSSTGSAVAVSAGFCSAAVGTDTCFSIVGCVTEHGVTGFKPGCAASVTLHTLTSPSLNIWLTVLFGRYGAFQALGIGRHLPLVLQREDPRREIGFENVQRGVAGVAHILLDHLAQRRGCVVPRAAELSVKVRHRVRDQLRVPFIGRAVLPRHAQLGLDVGQQHSRRRSAARHGLRTWSR